MSAGIVIVTHGQIGQSLIDVAEFILGQSLDMIHFVSFSQSEEDTTDCDSVRKVLQQADQGQGVLVLTDLPGASPSNLVDELLQETGALMVSGLNLAMLIRVWNYRETPVSELAPLAAEGGKLGIRLTQP